MNIIKHIKLTTIFFLLTFFLVAACNNSNEESSPDNSKIKVVSTTGMINDIVVNIAGDLVDSKSLMGPGVDPHLYRASANDVNVLSSADIIFYNGLHLEGKMSEIFRKMKMQGIHTVAVAETIDKSHLISPEEYEGNYDPHVWFNINLWKNCVKSVRDTMVSFDPANKDIYENNYQKYIGQLDQLHNYVLERAQSVPKDKRVLITAHDAFNYFGIGYGFEVIGLQGISTDTEASTSDVQRVTSEIVERKIPAVFIESSLSPRYIEAVKASVKSKGFDVKLGGLLYADALGNAGTPEGTYYGMFKHNIDTIVNALNGEGGKDNE